jgi:ATP-dependent helicase/DNAse subunit B
VVLAVGGTPIRARGIVDRIDASEDGQAWVVDYKSGRSAPAASAVQDGTSFQLFVYLLAARDLLGLQPVGGYYLKVSEPPGARGSLPRSGLLSCGSTVPKGQPPWPDLEGLLLEYLSAYASDIAAGHFPLLPVSADAAAEPCRYCDFRQICRVSEQRLRLGKQQSASRFARSRMRETRDA